VVRRRRRMWWIVWCVGVVVVVRRRMFVVVWLRRRMWMTQMGLEGHFGPAITALHVEGGCGPGPPQVQELLESPGGSGWELLLHDVVCGGGGHC
jgi:hypothetical protein